MAHQWQSYSFCWRAIQSASCRCRSPPLHQVFTTFSSHQHWGPCLCLETCSINKKEGGQQFPPPYWLLKPCYTQIPRVLLCYNQFESRNYPPIPPCANRLNSELRITWCTIPRVPNPARTDDASASVLHSSWGVPSSIGRSKPEYLRVFYLFPLGKCRQ